MGRKKQYKLYYPSARVHHLTMFAKDKNGRQQTSLETILAKIQRHEGSYLTYAVVLHDSDVYDAETVYQYEEKNKKTYIERLQILSDAKGLLPDETQEAGFVFDAELSAKAQAYADEKFPHIAKDELKPPHYHIILTFTVNRRADEIARWFDLEPNWDEVKTGKGAAESAWAYLVHANAPKKHQYEPSSVTASFDYETALQEQIAKVERHRKYEVDTYEINDVLEAVAKGLPLEEAKNLVSRAVYYRNQQYFERARKDYVIHNAPMPLYRQVFYIESKGIDADHGKGGLGKSACSKAFARQLAKEFGASVSKDFNDLNDYIYVCGDAKVFMQNYDGQPVLLLDEISGVDFKRALKGVNGVKSLLSPFPERKSIDKKHGEVVCTAKYIIINGIQSYKAFIRDLAEEATIDGVTQKSEVSVIEQFERRFWGKFIILDASQIEFWLNRGLFENTPEQTVMEMVARVKANFRMIASSTSGQAQAQIEGRVLNPVLEQVEKAKTTHGVKEKISDPALLSEELLSMGDVVIYDEEDL